MNAAKHKVGDSHPSETYPQEFTWHATEEREAKCTHHGQYTSVHWVLRPSKSGRNFWSQCPVCDDEIEQERLVKEDSEESRRRMREAAWAASNIPKRYWSDDLWNWQHPMDSQKKIWSWTVDYCRDFDLALATGRSAMIIGTQGTGKTHLGVGILKHVLSKGGSGYYMTVLDLLSRIKSTYDSNSKETEFQVVHDFATADVLIIDEVAKQLDTTYEQSQFFRLLDLRYRGIRPTILISNATKAELEEFLGDSIMDRMLEKGGTRLVCNWGSYRSRRRETRKE